ncbi:MAG: hypothetical protein JWO57_3118 [Pseudonocardiales bacterium]|nr:hypothetical protein [Pseudonocardiales bacterium]
MSPNEFQLRAALRDGEGYRLDPDTVLARARAAQSARRERRVRYGSIAAIVAVVAGIGVAGGIALGGGDKHTSNSSAGSAASERSAAGSSGYGASSGKAAATSAPVAPGPLAKAAAVPCPSTLPHLSTPGGGGTGQFGATGPLLSGAVEAVKMCAYADATGALLTGQNGAQLTSVVTGASATALAASLNGASTAPLPTSCPPYQAADAKSLVIIGVSTSGQAMKPVVAKVAPTPCNQRVTNGTAIRYGWTPPANLAAYLDAVRHAGQPSAQSVAPSGKVTGSPLHS